MRKFENLWTKRDDDPRHSIHHDLGRILEKHSKDTTVNLVDPLCSLAEIERYGRGHR